MRGPRSLRGRIAALLAAAFVGLGSSQLYLLWEQREAGVATERLAQTWVPLAQVVGRLDAHESRLVADLSAPEEGPAGVAGPLERYRASMARALSEARGIAERAQGGARSGEERAVFQRVLAHISRMEGLLGELTGAGDVRPDAARLQEEIDSLSAFIDDRVGALSEEIGRGQARGRLVSASLSAVALAFAAAAMAAVLYALRPVARLTAEVQRLAEGEYGRVEVAGPDEIAGLAAEFNAMVAALAGRDQALRDRAEELSRMSRYLSHVLDSLHDGLWVVEEGVVSLANPAAVTTWGITLGASAESWWLGGGSRELEWREGVRARLGVLPFGAGGWLLHAADITEAVEAAERLARSERLALVGQMLAQITHEVRNPLNALSLNAELLGDELLRLDPEQSSEASALLATVSHEIDRLTDLTGHYLQLARRPAAQREPVELTGILDEVARLLAPEWEFAGVGVTREVEEVGWVEADAALVKQALLNIARNAVEAGAKTLRWRLYRVERGVVCALSDDGEGMSAAACARATDPFFTTRAQGTGLGLALTRQILEDHGGEVQISSEPGQGAVIALLFP